MKHLFKHLILLLNLLFILACNKEKNSEVVFEKPANTSEDTTTKWLRNNDNYNNNKNYFLVFKTYYNNKLRQKNYEDAAKILDLVSTKLAFFYDFNQPFLNIIKEFDTSYRKKLPVLKTTFVDNYFGEYEYDKGNFNKACGYFKKTAVQEPNDYKSCQKIARAYYKLSYVYYGLGKQNLSLEANNKALKYSTKINDLEGLGAVYSNYTNIYRAIKDQ